MVIFNGLILPGVVMPGEEHRLMLPPLPLKESYFALKLLGLHISSPPPAHILPAWIFKLDLCYWYLDGGEFRGTAAGEHMGCGN